MAHSSANPFKWRQHKGKLIILCVRWYLAFTLSYRQLARMVQEHGWKVNHTSIFRWVQRYAPELAARCRAFLKPTNRSYRVDETYSALSSVCSGGLESLSCSDEERDIQKRG
jgi:transposase, IS6 family